MGWHIHPEYELVYVRNGRGRIEVDTKLSSYEDGLLIFLGPNLPHADFGNQDRADALEVVVQFGQEFVDKRLAAFPELAPLVRLTHRARWGLLFGKAIRKKLDNVFASLLSDEPADRLLGLLNILRTLSQAEAEDTTGLLFDPTTSRDLPPGAVTRLNATFSFVKEHYDQPISSADAAAYLGLTTNAFCRFFRQHAGRTFLNFLNDFRIERAKEMLHGPAAINEIVFTCGFRDASYFAKIFRRSVGCTPSVYRREFW